MVIIQLINQRTGNPSRGNRVKIRFGRTDQGTMLGPIATNENGEAYFNVKPGVGDIWINDREHTRRLIAGRIALYV